MTHPTCGLHVDWFCVRVSSWFALPMNEREPNHEITRIRNHEKTQRVQLMSQVYYYLWERVGGEGLVRQAWNNSSGFSPLSRRAPVSSSTPLMREEFLNGLRLKPAATLWLQFALRPSPQLSPKGRGSQPVPLPFAAIRTK